MKNFLSIKLQSFLIITSSLIVIYLLGFDFIKLNNQDWFNSGDLSTYQLGWKYFKEDSWRFPIGLNPNYGIYLNGSIIFSDSVPFFAIFFKIFKSILPMNFQYFSIWIFVCLYLQLFFSFKIIYNLTGNFLYSLTGSLFFIFAAAFIHRGAIHLSLFAHWIILSGFYIEIIESKFKNLFRTVNILLSLTIHFYFTIILFLFYVLSQTYRYLEKQIKFNKALIEIFKILFFAVLLMYFIGYFSINLNDGLGWGYGVYNFNLNSFFNPSGFTHFDNFSWSLFLPNLSYQNYEMEGFSYLGISGIIFLLLLITNLFYKKYYTIFSNKKLLIICIPFILLATSNNINIGETNILSIPFNNIAYLIFSGIRASGRLIWPVYYLIFFVGIIFIYKYFEDDKKAFLIILTLFLIQIVDLSSGLKNYKFGVHYQTKENNNLKDDIWNNIGDNFDQIRLLEPKNQSTIYQKIYKILYKENFLKTDIIYLARVNREIISNKKYELIKLYNKKNLEIFNNTIFLSDNLKAVQNLYFLYRDELYYYFADDLWLISNKPINVKQKKDYSYLLADFKKIELSKKNLLEFEDINNLPLGLGWTIKNETEGLIIDGFQSTLLFKINEKDCSKLSKIKIKTEKFFKNNKDSIKVKLFINENILENFNIINFEEEIDINFKCQTNKYLALNFFIDNPLSLYDLKLGLNQSKRSIILKSLSFSD